MEKKDSTFLTSVGPPPVDKKESHKFPEGDNSQKCRENINQPGERKHQLTGEKKMKKDGSERKILCDKLPNSPPKHKKTSVTPGQRKHFEMVYFLFIEFLQLMITGYSVSPST